MRYKFQLPTILLCRSFLSKKEEYMILLYQYLNSFTLLLTLGDSTSLIVSIRPCQLKSIGWKILDEICFNCHFKLIY